MQAPTGHIALVFTDIEGSTALWERFGDDFQPILNRHNEIIRNLAVEHEGYEVSTEGDAFFLVFRTAGKALQFASQTHDKLESITETSVRIRIGIHVGDPLIELDKAGKADYFGPAVNRAARVASAGHGGQTLLSKDASQAVRNLLQEDESFQFLGEHYFRGLEEPEGIYQHNRPDHQTDFEPLRGATQTENNLPAQTTTFIGRKRELKMLRELILGDAVKPAQAKPIDALTRTPGAPDTATIRLEVKNRDRGVRLSNITGPGGVGKSRLALALGGNLTAFFKDGIWYVDLADAKSPDEFHEAVAAVLGITLKPDGNGADQIAWALDQRKILLILDNFEHLSMCSSTLTHWLRAAAGLKIVVTSREVLHAEGESEFSLRPLETPRLSDVDADTRSFSLKVSSFAAVQLFLDRAVHARPGFALTPENAPHIASICDHLDGMPLAIELASARIRMMAPKQLAKRLEEGKERLAQRGRKGTTRNTTLHSAIEWSFDLLDPWEKATFLKLAIFEGPFSLETVEEVVALETPVGESDYDAPDVMDIVMNLRDKSLLVLRETDERVLFNMLGIMRRFARERWKLLAEGEVQNLHKAHAEYFMERASGLVSLFGARKNKNLKGSDSWGIADITVASNWLADHGDPDDAAQMVGSAASMLTNINRARELRELSNYALNALISRLGSDQALYDATDNAKLILQAVATSEHRCNNLERGVEVAQKCLKLLESNDDELARASCLTIIGLSLAFQRKLSEGREYLLEALEIQKRQPDKLLEAQALNNLVVSFGVNDTDEMVSILGRCLQLYTEANDKLGEARASNNLGIAYQRLGDLNRAEALFRRSLDVKIELQDAKGQCMSHANLGVMLQNQLRFEDALTEYDKALNFSREMTDRNQLAGLHAGLAVLYNGLGNPESALRHAEKDLELRRSMNDQVGIVQALSSKASALISRHDPEGARLAWEEMHRIIESTEGKVHRAACDVRHAQSLSADTRIQFIESLPYDISDPAISDGERAALNLLQLQANGHVPQEEKDKFSGVVYRGTPSIDVVYRAIAE
ncbi:adenylate/guanylate cyclase domain-containing protein [Planctomycetota bacterium]|nr:adenylate/guanylate cyclase domain-containing protein [Planctomycetota bacterium]